MFTIDLLPAGRGDCLWIEYGPARAPHRVLIDGGIGSTAQHLRTRIEDLEPAGRRFDLLVVTHIDLDHIAGVLELLRDPPDGLAFDDVWFNGWHHLPDDRGVLGAKQGERLATLIERHRYPWNEAFEGGPAALGADGTLPRVELRGGMALTLLSPTLDRLRRLRPVWEAELRKAGLEPGEAGAVLEGPAHPEDVADPGILGNERLDVDALARMPFRGDGSEANGSSIAVLAEYDGRRCLLTGDAYASDVERSVRALAEREGERALPVDALKLSHHGGKKNTSAELLDRLACPRFLFSTDGSYYDHPDPESVARVLVHGRRAGAPTLVFNYRSPEAAAWDDRFLYRGAHRYTPTYPSEADAGVSVDL